MSQVISMQLFSWMLYTASLFVLCLLLINRAEKIGKICLQGVMSVSFILIINCVLYKFGLCLGINIFTVLFAAVFGMPGIGLMYLLLIVIA